MQEKSIIYISSTNYRLVSAGTEKYIGELTLLFLKKKVHSIHIFPLSSFDKFTCKFGIKKSYIGINYDGEFEGVYLIDDLYSAIAYIEEKHNVKSDRVIINQLHDWNLFSLSKTLMRLNVSIVIAVHDYMMICSYMMMDDSDSLECGKIINKPSTKRCRNCIYNNRGIEYFNTVDAFFKEINSLICRVVFPSESAEKNWLRIFPFFHGREVIRPHLEYKRITERKVWGDKIRIGYLGTISEMKGYKEWLSLISSLDKSKFEFYYLGRNINKAQEDGAYGIMVDVNAKQTLGMAEQLRNHKIDIAFLWSKCLETYSYTYYESYEAGCWVLTSKGSGNIADQVLSNKNGVVFDNLDECISYLKNFKGETSFGKIENVKTNTSINEFEPITHTFKDDKKTKKPILILSWLYRYLRSSKNES